MKLLILILLLVQVASAQTKPVSDLKLKDLDGKKIQLSDYKGKVVLLNFWATWCSPCLAEIPELVKWQRKYSKAGLQIIGITQPPQTRREIQQFVRKLKINYPIIQGKAEQKSFFTASETLPWTIVIDRQGNIVAQIEGILFAEEFAEKIQPLLRQK
jgi:thiol-disulfide isomerase/thioredoxin